MGAAAVLAACSDHQPAAESPIPDTPLPVDIRSALADEDQRFTLVRAEERLTQNCMRDAGFSFEAMRSADIIASNRWNRLEDVFHFGPSGSSTGVGFGAVSSFTRYERAAANPNAAVTAVMSDGERQAWFDAYLGTSEELYTYTDPATGNSFSMPVDGCAATSRVELYGDFGTYVRLQSFPLKFAEEVYKRVGVDTQYQAVLSEWRTCVRQTGHDYLLPSEALGEVLAALSDGIKSETDLLSMEVDNFSAAVNCDAATGIHDTGWSLVPPYLDATLSAESATVAEYRDRTQRALEILEDE